MIEFFNKKKGLFWIAFICGFYPMVFYCSNNFYALNSWEHIGYFALFFIGLSLVYFFSLEVFFKVFKQFQKYRTHAIFISVVMVTACLMSWAIRFRMQKKLLLAILVVTALLSLKLHDRFRKIAILIGVMALLPVLTICLKLYQNAKSVPWTELAADIKDIELVEKPGVYLIQPDGYVNHTMMNGPLYGHETAFYDWLRSKEFTLYDDFRSNYPASISSNSSLFTMQHHYFGEVIFSELSIPMGRDMVSGQNTTNYVFQQNGYETYFLAQDEYFQQNMHFGEFSHYNITKDDIPYFSTGDEHVRVLQDDLRNVLENNSAAPKFVFIEKLLPHHIKFRSQGNQVEVERLKYIDKIEDVNVWLKETIDMIETADPNAIIVILADHGGWVGMTSYPDMFTTEDEDKIRSIFSAIAAVKWNGFLQEGYDAELRSSINLFRVLFANLTKDPSYLQQMEDNSSYNLHRESSFRNSVYKVLDDQGNFTFTPHNK